MSNQQPHGFQPVQSLPEEPSRRPWLLAVAALVLVGLGGVAIGALLFGGDAPPATPAPTAVAQPSPTDARPSPAATSAASTPTPRPAASPTDGPGGTPTVSPAAASPGGSPLGTAPPDVAALIDEVVGQVPPIRELDPLRDVPYEMVTREQFVSDLQAIIEEEVDPELLAAEERMLKRLGLLPDDLDLQELLVELYGAGVAAYYQPETSTFYVIERDAPFGPLDRMYVAHEYTHALQYQHFDLTETRITDPSQGDAALAQLAAVEGDATWLMVLWARSHLSFEELFELLGESLAPADQEMLEDMPPVLIRQLTFPYNEGLIFVSGIHGDGGWDAVNETFADPPQSTEQVLHPEKYLDREPPVAVEINDLGPALGDGWSRAYEQTMGELNVHVFAAADEEPEETLPGMPVEYPHADVAAGWGGDRLAMYEDGADGWAIVWKTAWDSRADAQEFAARADELRSTLDGVSLILETSEDEVWLLVANDQPTLDRLRNAGPL